MIDSKSNEMDRMKLNTAQESLLDEIPAENATSIEVDQHPTRNGFMTSDVREPNTAHGQMDYTIDKLDKNIERR